MDSGQPSGNDIRKRQQSLTQLSIKLALDASAIDDREILADAVGSLEEVERRLQRVWERIRSRLNGPRPEGEVAAARHRQGGAQV
jgi:hypothetical protein